MIKALIERLGLSRTNGTKAASGVDFVGAPDWSRVISLQGQSNPDAENLTLAVAYATSAYAFTAIDYRASRVAEPPLTVVQESDDGEEELPDHPLTPILQHPSPDYDMGELLYLTESYRLITGSALWIKALTQTNGLGRLIPFSGDDFSTESDPVEGLIYGRFRVDATTGPRFYLPEEVVHFREPNPNSWRVGTSRLDVALSRLNLGHQIDRTILNFARNAIFPGGVISPDKEWNPDPEEWQAYKNDIKAYHGGPSNAGDPLVLLGGTTFSSTAASMKDLLPDEILDRIEATVGATFGVPPVVLGWLVGLRNSPWSQMGEARRMVTEDTIEPRWRDVERRLTRSLLDEVERANGLKIQFDLSEVRSLFDDDMVKAQVAAAMRQEWTLNERRVYTGQEPLDDERGDELGAAPATGLFGGEQMSAGPPPEIKTHDDKGLQWLIFDGTCKAAERTWAKEIQRGLNEWRAGIIRIAKDTIRTEKDIAPTSAEEFQQQIDEWMTKTGKPVMKTLVFPLIQSTGEKAVRQVSNHIGASFDVFQESILRYAERETDFLVGAMGETTAKKVAGIVQKGLNEGDILSDMVNRLKTDAAFSESRAKLVARTETTRAWNGSQRESMSQYAKDSGRIVHKTWLAVLDDRVREEHAEMDGEQVDIDAAFSNGLTEPGEPNCRCTLTYQITDPLGDSQ